MKKLLESAHGQLVLMVCFAGVLVILAMFGLFSCSSTVEKKSVNLDTFDKSTLPCGEIVNLSKGYNARDFYTVTISTGTILTNCTIPEYVYKALKVGEYTCQPVKPSVDPYGTTIIE